MVVRPSEVSEACAASCMDKLIYMFINKYSLVTVPSEELDYGLWYHRTRESPYNKIPAATGNRGNNVSA